MNITETSIPGLLLIELGIFHDQRGYFLESYQSHIYRQSGIDLSFVQDNFSYSKKNVLRGMHYQIEHPFGQLIWVLQGEIFDVLLDLRPQSPTFKQSFSIYLSSNKPMQVYMPPGIAHGFSVLSSEAMIHYKCSDYYYPKDEGGIAWHSVDVKWPTKEPILSARDQKFITLDELTPDKLPKVEDYAYE